MSSVPTEQVLVVPTALLHQIGYFQGFMPDVERYLDTLLDPRHTSYRPRQQVEQDPTFKQLIPYVVFCHARPDGQLAVFRYTRGKGQGEQRLHSKRSVGIGGHISSDDSTATEPYLEGMQRELDEEVAIDTEYQQKCVGLINDDETDVGRVHLGVVHLFQLASPNVHPRESEIIETGFHPVGELLTDLDGYETWSQICLEALFRTDGGHLFW